MNWTVIATTLLLVTTIFQCEREQQVGTIQNQMTKPDNKPEILMLGNSLSAGYRIPANRSMPALIQNKTNSNKMNYIIINAGVSGDTTADALIRLPGLLKRHNNISFLIIELGANDLIQQVAILEISENIKKIIRLSRQANSEILIAIIPFHTLPKLIDTDPEYGHDFDKLFAELALSEGIILLPFLLKDITGHPHLLQSDGLHPNEAGTIQMSETIWQALKKHLKTTNNS